MAARFERVVAVSFAFPEEVLRPMVPKDLEVDTYRGFGFITAALVWTEALRPVVVPAFFGQDFFLAGYRIFTRLNDGGRRLRGLQILRSETDRHRMVWLGNLMTHYRYRRVNVRIKEDADGLTQVTVTRPDGRLSLDLSFALSDDAAGLPPGSPFADWTAARRFAGPMPFTFSREGDAFVVIEGSRQNWMPRPVAVHQWRIGLFDEAPLRGVTPILANAFTVSDVDYQWKRGRLVSVGGGV